MNWAEFGEILARVIVVLGAAERVIGAIKELGVDMSGIKVHTSTPIDVSAIINKVV